VVESGLPRELTEAEEKTVNEFRFGKHFTAGGGRS
jgi:hypothetical protein